MPGALIPTTDGRLVDGEWLRLAEIISDYDQWLELRWIPPENRTRDDKAPYCVVDTRPPGEYVVLHATELDRPHEILARIFDADNANGDALTRMENRNTAAELMRLKDRIDTKEMQKDFAAFLMGTEKNFIDTRNPLTGKMLHLDDQLRPRR